MKQAKLVDRIGQFTTIPNNVIKIWSEIGMDAFALFVCLRFHSDEHDECFPSYDLICQETTMTRRRVSAAIKALEKYGLLTRKRRFGQSTVYHLNPPPISTPSELLTDDPVVQHGNYSSSTGVLSVVPQGHTNQTHLTRLTEPDSFNTPENEKSFSLLRENSHPTEDSVPPEKYFTDREDVRPKTVRGPRTEDEVIAGLAASMEKGAARHSLLQDEIMRSFNINPNFGRKDWKDFLQFLKERPDGETIDRFAKWWYSSDWRGVQGQSPDRPDIIRQLWPQAFTQSPQNRATEVYG